MVKIRGNGMETHDGRADMTNFEMDLFDTRINIPKLERSSEENSKCCNCGNSRNRIIKTSLYLASPIKLTTACSKHCKSYLIESIPTGVPFPTQNSTADAWIQLIDNTKRFLDISVMYWNLNSSDYKTAIHGKLVYQALIRAGKRGVKIRIAQDGSSNLSDNLESKYLVDQGLAELREINVTKLIKSGIIHTKFMISDISTVYIGSANMDWKSLSEVKEVGIVVTNCPCVAGDLYKIFAAYWKLGEKDARVPDKWPISYRTPFNFSHMGNLPLNDKPAEFFISSSPAEFNPKNREHDLKAIQKIMANSNSTICISVMDYIPATIYMKKEPNRYWSEIDDSIRGAAYRGVEVRMLISHWNHSRKEMIAYLKSLEAINDGMPKRGEKQGKIKVKIFTVPADAEQQKIPFSRVNHAKYMVTESISYIGTSNWAGDYFISTAGVAMVIKQEEAVKRLQNVFDRDWNSEYAEDLS
ncbi:unnamed protein product [Caenorhabditis angaria]|uniref:PLD phosphodiesterase domain-containing protein n=1 Tax=Caenorhabditis angaria TaxID=860376 RepID=A0A9P1N725_9PELO|nr:unnamed protein product [Caenorhabditis angaria]